MRQPPPGHTITPVPFGRPFGWSIHGECRIGHIAKHGSVAHGAHGSAELCLSPHTLELRRRSIGPKADDVFGRYHGLCSNLEIPFVTHFLSQPLDGLACSTVGRSR